jgi:hypothetical protein
MQDNIHASEHPSTSDRPTITTEKPSSVQPGTPDQIDENDKQSDLDVPGGKGITKTGTSDGTSQGLSTDDRIADIGTLQNR